jgi:hypothetical protein
MVPGMRAWGAVASRHQFVISHEDGTQLRPEDRSEWTGYTASYKSVDHTRQAAVRLDGRWETFAEAERACREALRQLRNSTARRASPEDIALAEEVLSRPPVELTDEVLRRMTEREVEIGCEIDRMTQHFPPAEQQKESDK